MNMGLLSPAVLLVLGVSWSYATQIKYIVRSGPFDSNPEEIAREIHSLVGVENALQPTTEAYQDCTLDGSCSDLQADGTFGAEGTFKPFPQEHLEKILQKFQKGDNKVANVYVDRADVNDEAQSEEPAQPLHDSPQSSDKSKSWNVINSQSHNKQQTPYDDRQGWVTLEPIAWSSSQIQKWEPNPRPTFPPPNEAANYWNGPSPSKPSPSYGPPQSSSDRPPWSKPSYEYQMKPQWGNKWPANQNYEYKPSYSGGSWGGNSDIITDNRPGSFPPDNRPGSHSNTEGGSYRPWGGDYPGNHPMASHQKPSYAYGSGYSSSERPSSASSSFSSTGDGDGHWVLLSSTKGYSIPQRHRSNSRSMNLKRDNELPKVITANVVNHVGS